MTVHFVDRFHRKETIWQIEDRLREAFQKITGLKYVDVYDYGATPMSSIKANVDLMISGPDPAVLDTIGADVMERMRKVRGLTSFSRSWTYDKKEITFRMNLEKAAFYGMSPITISQQVAAAVRGGVASVFRVPGQDGYLMRVQFAAADRKDLSSIKNMFIQTSKGAVPLKELGQPDMVRTQTSLTRQYLQPTLDIYGYRSKASISHIHDDLGVVLKDLRLPAGYTLTQEGEMKQMKESFGLLMAALGIGLVLLYFSLVPAFNSWVHPLTIMSAIPLALIGAVWAMLLTGKHQCMPSFMGMILLAGIVVKNSILLIDFIEEERGKGQSLMEAIVGSVRIRTRPILMTAVGTSVGMIPIALEWAIGLERLSPLAIVAIGGLMVSTFLTLVYVPILYSLFDELTARVKTALRFKP
jgi:multidrug efflux pump subunit AcrB